MTALREGGCACGAVRYRIEGEPVFVNNCHCRLCQRQTGAASAINAFYEVENASLISGALSRHEVATGSGKMQQIFRCSQCGTAIWSIYPGIGEHGYAVRTGTLDQPDSVTPDAAIYVDYRPAWLPLPEGIPSFGETYRAPELLPPERLARLRAIVAKRTAT